MPHIHPAQICGGCRARGGPRTTCWRTWTGRCTPVGELVACVDFGSTFTKAALVDVRSGITESVGGVDLILPDAVVGDSSLAVLPPTDGWQLPIAGVSGDIVPVVDEAVAEFRKRSAAGADPQRLAQEIWERPGFGGLPVRALHAARRLGFLSDDASRVSASTCTGWKRLTTVRGQVFVRTVPPVGRPRLLVVR